MLFMSHHLITHQNVLRTDIKITHIYKTCKMTLFKLCPAWNDIIAYICCTQFTVDAAQSIWHAINKQFTLALL